jgi:hypothetical protein
MTRELELKDLLTAAMLPERRAAVEVALAEIVELRAEVERLKAAIAEYNYTSTAKSAEVERLTAMLRKNNHHYRAMPAEAHLLRNRMGKLEYRRFDGYSPRAAITLTERDRNLIMFALAAIGGCGCELEMKE